MSLGVTTANLRASSQNRSSTGAMPAKNRPDRLLPRHQQAEFSSATRHGAISIGCQIQRSAESKESKTLSVFRSHSGFLNKEFEHRLVRINGTLFANPQGNQMEPPLVIHAMSNSGWLFGFVSCRAGLIPTSVLRTRLIGVQFGDSIRVIHHQ